MDAILKCVFKKWKQLHFSEENYLNYIKGHNCACDIYIFSETRENKSKQWTFYSALKGIKPQ